MANNRIIYATAQLSVKDNRADATNHILGSRPDGVLASGISAGATVIPLTVALSGQWPLSGQVRIKTSGGTFEYIRYAGWQTPSQLQGCTRGTAGTTAQSHSAADKAQLVGWEVPFGVQSVSIGTTFNLEDVFHLGQLDAYENVEGIPDVEVSIE